MIPKIADAARLTRAGRLSEAADLLKGVLPASLGAVKPPISSADAARSLLKRMQGVADQFAPASLKGGVEPFWPGSAPGRSPHRDAGSPNEPGPPGARFDESVFSSAGGSRPYKLYVPSTYDGSALPLVVMLHGCKQSPDDFAAGTRLNALAEEFGLLVAYPGQTVAANGSKCWNWFDPDNQQRDRGEPALIAGITREIMQRCSVDPRRVFVAGLSAGGAQAAVLGAAYPDLYAAVCVHSGLACGAAMDVPSAFAAMRDGGSRSAASVPRPIPTIVFHGDRDGTVHPANGDQVIAQAASVQPLQADVTRGRSADGVAYTRTVQRDTAGHAVLEQWVLHGAGHAWSGGSTAGSYTNPRGPDASRAMLAFFLGQPRRALADAA